LEDGTKSEEAKIKGAPPQRSEEAPLVKETAAPAVTKKAEKTIEGVVRRFNEADNRFVEGFFVVLN
jgi:hypothetical protein